jgi:hypothetical protein
MELQQMKKYIGTKIVLACPMTREDAEKHLGRVLRTGKEKDDDHDEGYLVEYESGYQSWSPADAFKAYRPYGSVVDRVNFELEGLLENVSRLKAFIGTDVYEKTLSGKHKMLLLKQLEAMLSYGDVLSERIEDLEEL